MPLDMVVAPLTLGHTVEVVCDEADDEEPDPELALEAPMAMPAIDSALPPEPEPVLVRAPEPAVFAVADPVDVGCDDASETVVAASTRTAATPTVANPAPH